MRWAKVAAGPDGAPLLSRWIPPTGRTELERGAEGVTDGRPDECAGDAMAAVHAR